MLLNTACSLARNCSCHLNSAKLDSKEELGASSWLIGQDNCVLAALAGCAAAALAGCAAAALAGCAAASCDMASMCLSQRLPLRAGASEEAGSRSPAQVTYLKV
jgi:hypothetical protein